jgi:hypothetical protein
MEVQKETQLSFISKYKLADYMLPLAVGKASVDTDNSLIA